MASKLETELGSSPDEDATKVDIGSVNEAPARIWNQQLAAVVLESPDKSPKKRKLIAKTDLWIPSCCCNGCFVKYLDQTNIHSAFVSWTEGDLSMHGHQTNLFPTFWNIGRSCDDAFWYELC